MRKQCFGLALLLTAATLVTSVQIAPAQTKAAGDPRIKAALDKIGWKYEIDKDGDFKVGMKLEGGRTQVAWILSQTEKLDNMEIRQIVSPAYQSEGPLPATVANQLLADSARKKLGNWQTATSGKTYIALYAAKIPADTDVKNLESSLMAVLYSADGMEKTLTGKDDF